MEILKDIFTELVGRQKWILLSSLLLISQIGFSQSSFKIKKNGNHYETTSSNKIDTCVFRTRLRPYLLERDSLILFDFDLAHRLSTGFILNYSILLDSCSTKRIPIFGYGSEKEKIYGLSARKFRIGKRNRRRFILKIGDLKCLKLKYKDYEIWKDIIIKALEEISQKERSAE